MNSSLSSIKIAVVIPSYKVKKHILALIARIEDYVTHIYVVDDCCPEGSGQYVLDNCSDSRVQVIFSPVNQGVGGAVMLGYKHAIKDKVDVVVKLDGDGQMNPTLIPLFVRPILEGKADYTKGNRFYDPEKVREMPKIRIFGNIVLSFLNKISSGYWNIFDPTNGYTAISREVLELLPLDKISKRYFFESDMLFRLNTIRAVVKDISMKAVYADEVSGLKIKKIIGEFLFKHLRNFSKRIFYNYYLRDFSIASLELPIGIFLFIFGLIFGCTQWIDSISSKVPASSGTVMLAALPIIAGLQFILFFINYDINTTPVSPITSSKIHKKF